MEKQALYRDLARYYDLIYSWKDYEKEVSALKELFSEYRRSPGTRLLDVGCGTGHHIEHLKDEYACTGLDVSEAILEVARENVEGVEFVQADMTCFDLERRFDVITCLFSSIGYVKTLENLEKTYWCFAAHLVEGGAVFVEPWFTREVYSAGGAYMSTYDGEDVKVARLNVSEIDGDVSVMDMHYLIAERDKGVRHYVDRHELGLFEVDETLRIMDEAGLEAQYQAEGLMPGRGLYIGIKR